MTILYPAQTKVVDKVMKFIDTYKFQIITGEVGSGKTYMGSEAARRCVELGKSVLVISPQHVVEKWKLVLNEIFNSHNMDSSQVKIVTKFTTDLLYQYDVVIYDEIHEIKSKISKFRERIIYQDVTTSRKHDGEKDSFWTIGLTGSIIDSRINDITDLTNGFSNNGKRYPMYSYMSQFLSSRTEYVRLFIQVCLAHGISREEAQNVTEQKEAIVNVHEVSIDMSNEESAFYNFAESRMKAIDLPHYRQMKILNDCLDRVSTSNTFRFKNLDYFVGDRLVSDSVIKDQLLKVCLESTGDGTLIYVLNDDLGQRIVKNNNSLVFYDAKSRVSVAEKEINELLAQQKNVVVNISHIQTGVDLHTNNLIWYQTPLKLVQDIQGTGRITRLSSSKEEKHVYYLYHQNTMQEKLVNELKMTRELNNDMIRKANHPKNSTISNKSKIPFFENLVQ